MSVTPVAPSEQPIVGIVVDETAPAPSSIISAIEGAGARFELWTPATAISRGAAAEAVVFGLEASSLERLLPVAAVLDGDPRTRWKPRVFLVDEDVPASRLASFGAGALVTATSAPETFGLAIERALEQARARRDAQTLARSSVDDLRALEQTLAAVQRDGATLSHDARVLFGVILGFASNMRDGFAGPITEEQRQHVQNILDASNDAAALLERYAGALRRAIPRSIDPAHATAARVATRQHLDLGELVRGTVALFHGIASAKQIRLAAEASRAVFAWCDPMQVKQALVNLLSNALKFTPAGGRVNVSVRPGPLGSARSAAMVRPDVEIVVSDTGPGIPEHERSRVFERGVRLERDLSTPGTGQGLAIVREIAELHGGLVRIDEAPGGGASLALVVPADRRGRSGEQAAVSASSAPPRVYSVPPSSARPT